MSTVLCAAQEAPPRPSFDYEAVRAHEIQPHRRTIPHEGVHEGFNQLHLKLIVSAKGDVLSADADGDKEILPLWPELKEEVLGWKFTPFEEKDVPIEAEVEEYIDLVPPERFPTRHEVPPKLNPNSRIEITLERSGCFGTCPGYRVAILNKSVEFDGGSFVVAVGKHIAQIDPEQVRTLARKIIAADFYSMDETYHAGVTDNPTYSLSISIDGQRKGVVDYVGSWVGMPALISDLEDAVDQLAETGRWIRGTDGLVDALEAEKYNFKSFEAQVMLKEAAQRGATSTVEDLLDAGVQLKPLPAPKPKEPYQRIPFENEGWLTTAASHFDTLQILIDAGASENDQKDKNLALFDAARSGQVESVRALIDYGADTNANMGTETVIEHSGNADIGESGPESVLIYAAESGNPDMVREILRYHPAIEARDREGKTAMFGAGESRYNDKDGARVEIVRMLANAGANVNARDNDGDTPLHGIFLTDVEEELLKLGADVNTKNKDGETPIFTNVDNDSVALFIKYGADLNIRDNKGRTVMDAAKEEGPLREEALRKAIAESQKPQTDIPTAPTAPPGP
jgi:ankyrin repeat protein